MAQETARERVARDLGPEAAEVTRNLEIPIAICIAGIVYLALLYSVIWYLE